jgi:hypothetical protein
VDRRQRLGCSGRRIERGEQRFLEAQERVRDGEADLDRLVAERGELGLDTWRRMVVSAETALDAARAALYELPDPGLPEGDVA